MGKKNAMSHGSGAFSRKAAITTVHHGRTLENPLSEGKSKNVGRSTVKKPGGGRAGNGTGDRKRPNPQAKS